jgi:hypothetical protein
MSNIIFIGVQALDDQKGSIIDSYFYPLIGTSPERIVAPFNSQNSLPVNSNNIVSNFTQRPDGFLLDITDTVFFDLPVTVCIFAFGLILFRLLYSYRISVLFRHYSILGCFFYVLLDGKIEIFTFFFVSELLLLTSSCFRQKLQILAMVFSYFLVFLSAVSSMLLYRSAHRKLLKYVYENCRQPLSSSFYMSFSFGIYNILLGFFHRLLLPFPLPQLYLLILLEFAYFLYVSSLLFRSFYSSLLLGVTLCAMNLSRLAFLLTLLLYEMAP